MSRLVFGQRSVCDSANSSLFKEFLFVTSITTLYSLYATDKYSLPPEDQLDGLGEDEYAKIVFVNREEAWVYIEYVDDADKVYGKLCDYMRSVDLHKNQRVWFAKDRIAEVKAGDDSD